MSRDEQNLIRELRRVTPEVLPRASLAGYSTFRLGGPCRLLVNCRQPHELRAVVHALSAAGERFLLMGGGSNLLISDEGVEAVVVRYAADTPRIVREGGRIRVSGSSDLDAVVQYCVAAGLQGINYCSGIPGTLGGAVAGNAGAWGRQIADAIESVRLLDHLGRERVVPPEELDFGYRRSALQDGGSIVTEIELGLRPVDPRELVEERGEILRKREERHPDWRREPCIGSIYRNLEPSSAAERRMAAGWFLEQAGAKQMSVGGARVFAKHANIIVAGAGCTAQNVFDLAEAMKLAVREKFDFELVREVRYLGRFRGGPDPVPWGFF